MTTYAKTIGALALSAMLLGIGTGTPLTQTIPGKPDAARGASLAAKLCVNCHVAKAELARPVIADVPTFSEIANKDGRTAEWIAGKIMLPVHPMPTFNVSRAEIGHLVAYIQSLKKTE